MTRTEKQHIVLNSNGFRLHYVGYILSEDDIMISFNDRKLGLIRLNKKNIELIEPFIGGKQ